MDASNARSHRRRRSEGPHGGQKHAHLHHLERGGLIQARLQCSAALQISEAELGRLKAPLLVRRASGDID